ncbi:hypothetical protein ACWGE0_29790 [Lentzea sp. NPDC054927]
MRKLIAVVAGCLLLAGCAASWQNEVRYKIVSADDTFFRLELVGDAPNGSLKADGLSRNSVLRADIGGAAVGDEVLCVVEQKKGGAFEDSNVVTNVKSCKKA